MAVAAADFSVALAVGCDDRSPACPYPACSDVAGRSCVCAGVALLREVDPFRSADFGSAGEDSDALGATFGWGAWVFASFGWFAGASEREASVPGWEFEEGVQLGAAVEGVWVGAAVIRAVSPC